MRLRDQVFHLCRKLSSSGWQELLKGHGLNIDQSGPAALEKALLAPLKHVDRTIPGFEDYASNGRRGIEPGSLARSLLYHALASPAVTAGLDGRPLDQFPTLADLESVENYVFGIEPPVLEQLIEKAGPHSVAIVVFAQQYRPAQQTCHRLHADMVYSRTGVARVGTADLNYRGELRGFVPQIDNDPFALAVLPARYASYLAVRMHGDAHRSQPMRFRDSADAKSPTVRKPDDKRNFWLPIHKLFTGSECLDGLDLHVTLSACHFNEKIRRIHLQLTKEDHRFPPYLFCDGIAEFSAESQHGDGVLAPVVHPRLVEPAQVKTETGLGAWVTYWVNKDNVDEGYSSVALDEQTLPGGVLSRNTPQYVNAKTQVLDSNELLDLNQDSRTLFQRVKKGRFRALHYVDFTGDGWIKAHCPELEGEGGSLSKAAAAYSLVTAPDFFPSCDQVTLTEWSASLPKKFTKKGSIWKETPPDALSDQRFPGNLQLPVVQPHTNPFEQEDDSITALVSHINSPTVSKGRKFKGMDVARHNHLPDDAAGIFDPGWDVSLDHLPHDKSSTHLAAYGLGSPFPEDAKLCAALSAYWPAVSPDTTRVMQPLAQDEIHTTCPLTDEEIGESGLLPWDGVPGPHVVELNGQEYAEFADFHHVDYVQNALAGKFSLRLTAAVDYSEYEARVLAMAAVHSAISRSQKQWNNWIVLSFRVVQTADGTSPHSTVLSGDVQEFEAVLKVVNAGSAVAQSHRVYRFEMLLRLKSERERKNPGVAPYDFRKRLLPIRQRRVFFADVESRQLFELRPDGRGRVRKFY